MGSMTSTRGPKDEIVELLVAGYPILYILSSEEERVERLLARLAQSLGKPPLKLFVWSVTGGLLEPTAADNVQKARTLGAPRRSSRPSSRRKNLPSTC